MNDVKFSLDLKAKAKIVLDDGQDKLLNVYSKPVVNERRNVVASVDGGSTSTRTLLLLNSDDLSKSDSLHLDDPFVIPSTHAETSSTENILPQSEALWDNLDSTICDTTNESGIIKTVRVVRGSKYISGGFAESRLNSSRQKIDTPAFYINVIDGIAYSLLMKEETLARDYDVYLGISLPPKDVNSTANQAKFRERMLNTFAWTNKDLGITINLHFKGVVIQTEPEANVKTFYSGLECEMPEKVLSIEAGGSTIGLEILKGGKTIGRASQTLPYGGTQLKNDIAEIYSEEYGAGVIKDSQLDEVLKTGVLKKGRNKTDMVPIIIKADKAFASRIFNDMITKCFDSQSQVNLDEIEAVVFSGRLFRGGNFEPVVDNEAEDASKGITSYSLATPLGELIDRECPGVDFKQIGDNLIPLGNLLNALKTYGGFIQENKVEEPSASVEVATTEGVEENSEQE